MNVRESLAGPRLPSTHSKNSRLFSLLLEEEGDGELEGTGSGDPFTTGFVPGTDAPCTAVHGAAQSAVTSTGVHSTIVELSTVGMLPLIAPSRAATLETDDSVLLIASPVVDGDRLPANSGAVTTNSVIIVPRETLSALPAGGAAAPVKRRSGQSAKARFGLMQREAPRT